MHQEHTLFQLTVKIQNIGESCVLKMQPTSGARRTVYCGQVVGVFLSGFVGLKGFFVEIQLNQLKLEVISFHGGIFESVVGANEAGGRYRG